MILVHFTFYQIGVSKRYFLIVSALNGGCHKTVQNGENGRLSNDYDQLQKLLDSLPTKVESQA